MNADTAIGLLLVLLLGGTEAWILWRYPDLRRALIAHWRPEAIAARMDRWVAERAKGESRSGMD